MVGQELNVYKIGSEGNQTYCRAEPKLSTTDTIARFAESDECVLTMQGELWLKTTGQILIAGKCRPSAAFCESKSVYAVAFSDNCVLMSNGVKI